MGLPDLVGVAPASDLPDLGQTPTPERDPQLAKRAAFGVIDNAFAPLAIAGLGTAAVKYPYLRYVEGQQSGQALLNALDNGPIRLTNELRDGVRHLMGINGDPVTIPEHLAEFASLAVPVAGVATGIGRGTTFLSKALKDTTALMSPAPLLTSAPGAQGLKRFIPEMTKGNAARYGAHIGLGLGIQQGGAEALNKPSIFHPYDDRGPPDWVNAAMGGNKQGVGATSGGAIGQTQPSAASGLPDLGVQLPDLGSPETLPARTYVGAEAFPVIRQQPESRTTPSDIWEAVGITGVMIAALAGGPRVIQALSKRAPDNLPKGNMQTSGGPVVDAKTPRLAGTFETNINEHAITNNIMDNAQTAGVISPTVRDFLAADLRADPHVQAVSALRTGDLGDATRIVTEEALRAMRAADPQAYDLYVHATREYRDRVVGAVGHFNEQGQFTPGHGIQKLEKLGQRVMFQGQMHDAQSLSRLIQTHMNGTDFHFEDLERLAAALPGSRRGVTALATPMGMLHPERRFDPAIMGSPRRWQERYFSSLELKDLIDAGDANPQMKAYREALESNAAIIRNFQAQKVARTGNGLAIGGIHPTLLRIMDFGRKYADGSVRYIPAKDQSLTPKSWGRVILDSIGWRQRPEVEYESINGFYRGRAVRPGGGIQAPLDSVASQQHYVAAMYDDMRRTMVRGMVLEALTNPALANSVPSYKGLVAKYGTKAYDDMMANANVKGGTEKVHVFSVRDKDLWDTTGRQQSTPGVNTYATTNRMLYQALEMQPHVYYGFQGFNNKLRTIIQEFKTGRAAPWFGPIGALFNTYVTWALRPKGSKYTPFVHDWKGFVDKFVSEFGEDLRQTLEVRSQQGLGNFVPTFMRGWANTMIANAAKESINRGFQGIGVESHSRFLPTDIQGIFDIGQRTIPALADNGHAGKFLWRTYNYLLSAMHNASTHGYALANADLGWRTLARSTNPADRKVLNNMFRRLDNEIRNRTADISNRPMAGTPGDWFVSTVPYGNVTLQALVGIARAFKEDPHTTFNRIAFGFGVPMATLYAYNMLMPQEHRDWYYGLPPESRHSYMYMMIPWLPPDRSIAIPVLPELRMFKAIIETVLDLTFGLGDRSSPDNSTGMVMRRNGLHSNPLTLAGIVSFGSMLSLPAPALLQLGVNATGNKIEMGPDASKQGLAAFLPFHTKPVSMTKFGMGKGEDKHIDASSNATFDAMMETMFSGVWSGLDSVFRHALLGDKPDPSVYDRFSAAIGAMGTTLAQKTPYANILWGQRKPVDTYGPNAEEIEKITQHLSKLSNEFEVYRTGGSVNTMKLRQPVPPGSVQIPTNPDFINAMPIIEMMKKDYRITETQKWKEDAYRLIERLKVAPMTESARSDAMHDAQQRIATLNYGQLTAYMAMEKAVQQQLRKRIRLTDIQPN